MSDSSFDNCLPGMETIGELLAGAPIDMSDEEIDKRALQRFPQITLERIKAERPDLVKMVARAYFCIGASLRDISFITGLHRDTCTAIINCTNATDEIKSIKKAKMMRVHALGNRALMRVQELLEDDKAVKKEGIKGMLDVTLKLQDLECSLRTEVEGNVVDVPVVPGFKTINDETDAERFLN